MINFANWMKLFAGPDPQGRHMLIAKEEKKKQDIFLALLAGLREIRLIMTPFRVLMADCLQVFSDVFFIQDMMVELGAGHCHTRGGLSNPATVRNCSLFQQRKVQICGSFGSC